MPLVNIYYPLSCPSMEYLPDLTNSLTREFNIPSNKAWVIWNEIKVYHKPDWNENINNPAPIIDIKCRELYSREQVKSAIYQIIDITEKHIKCNREEIFICFSKIKRGDLYSFGNIWQ